MTSRALAILCLVDQERRKEPVDQLFDQHLKRSALADERDRQLAMALIYGVLRHRQELDLLLQGYCKKPLPKLELPVLQALRIGLFQLLFLQRIPHSAAVNETVKGLGRQPKWLKGFVNGVLRAMVRDIDRLVHNHKALPVSKRLNHPQWLLTMWEEQFGAELTQDICLANNNAPPLCLRLNPSKTSRQSYLELLSQAGISGLPGRYAAMAVILPEFHGAIAHLPGYDEGLFHVQDEAAQLIASFFTDLPAGTFLDGCAGLGGKTILLDQVLPAGAQIMAVEPHQGRGQLLQENLDRCQCRSISLFTGNLQEFAAKNCEPFTGILLDVPCSGLGVIGRQPDIRWNRRQEDLNALAVTQSRLLHTAAPLVAPGGHLVYVTCSLSRQENEDVISSFLNVHPDFSIAPPPLQGAAKTLLTSQGFLRTLPSQGLDGFFAARLLRSIDKNASHS